NQYAAAFDCFALHIQGIRDTVYNVLWHARIDLASQLNKTRMLTIFAGLPCEIKRIDRDTVATETWSRIERSEPKRLRASRFDNFPDINSHGSVNQLELVNQCDIDTAKDIFQQLGSFSDPTGGD